MFYTAEALLYERGLRSRKHSGVHSLFGEHFAKPGLIEAKFHRWLVTAFNRRLQGDYAFEATITGEEVRSMIHQAREFLNEARRLLEAPRQPER